MIFYWHCHCLKHLYDLLWDTFMWENSLLFSYIFTQLIQKKILKILVEQWINSRQDYDCSRWLLCCFLSFFTPCAQAQFIHYLIKINWCIFYVKIVTGSGDRALHIEDLSLSSWSHSSRERQTIHKWVKCRKC